jgi:hypothetical protein
MNRSKWEKVLACPDQRPELFGLAAIETACAAWLRSRRQRFSINYLCYLLTRRKHSKFKGIITSIQFLQELLR